MGKKVIENNKFDNLTVPTKEASANYVPAAAVIRKMRALSGITGYKAYVGG